MQPTKETLWSKVSTKLLEVDKFPDTFQMPFAKGMASLPSRIGVIATIVLLTVVGGYSITIFSLFSEERKGTTISAVFEQAFGYDEIFGAEQDLNIAVGLDGAVDAVFERNG